MQIQLLDDATVGKIAAGEIIERPASVVKELVENSLDAGARSLRIELRGGGTELIRVSDDGAGISAAEIPLALERHATSKLRSFSDLNHLQSYGFRGEALASIAAVSDLTIVSRTGTSEHATRLRSRFGAAPAIEPAAAPPGTTITVRDLFANVPARRKFLRQEQTEAAYVQRAVVAAALAHPEVRVEVVVDGKPTLRTDGSGDLANTVVDVFGPEMASQMVAIEPIESDGDSDRPPVTVTGYVSLPTLTRGNRQQIVLLVNRRWIESRSLSFALEQSYHSLIMVGRYPIAVVNVDIPPERLDVNVHPTKREVRFSDERLVFAAIQRAVRGTLVQYTPGQTIPTIAELPLSAPSVQRRLALAHPERFREPRPDLTPAPGDAGDMSDPAAIAPSPASDAPILRVLGQVGGTYIIAEGPDGMYMVDQHAAHERVLFERLWTRYEQASPDVQQMLEPIVVELSPMQLSALEQSLDEMRQIGFQLEPFGGSAVAIRAVPAIATRRDPVAILLGILDEMIQGGRGTSRLESLVISTACHSAIRAGQPLSLPEMRELIGQLESCTAPRACGHGRPTMLHMSQDEMERQFARR